MRLDQGTIREILSKTDIGAFIGSYVQLKKRGNDLVGLCPFHGEKTPSFHVHPDRGFFKCFGCGQSGDAIKFMQLHENLAFPEAARLLAQRAGVVLEAEDPAQARVRGEKERIYQANEVAASFFHRTLRMAPEAEHARAYVAGRGLDTATIDAFKIGFAPDSWDALLRELDANGVARETAEAAGLLRQGQSGFYDFYRNRLMIPTYATTGEAVAFGGRSLDGREPKYLNTSTTPVYTKGRGLYALNVARRAAAAKDGLVVVEGYLDCIALHQGGFPNAVASLGTAFTAQQAAELRKYAERIFLCFDADAAGTNATVKSIDVLNDAGCAPFIVQLPPGEDPDTFIRTHGAAAFQTRLDSALPWIQFKLDRDVAEILRTRLPRAQAAARAETLVRELPRAEWDRWRVYAAQALDLSIDDLRVSRFAADRANFAPRAGAAATRHIAPTAEPPSIEREVLAALLDEPALFADYYDRFSDGFFRDTRYAKIFETLGAQYASLATPADVYAALAGDAESVELVVALLKPDRSSQVRFQDSSARRAHLDRVLERISTERLEGRYRELDAKIDQAFLSGAPVSTEERDEHRRLREEMDKQRKKRLGTRA